MAVGTVDSAAVTVGAVGWVAVAVVGVPLFEAVEVAASEVTPAESGPAVALLVAGADGEAVSAWVAPPWAALVPMVAAVFWPAALVAAAVVGGKLADCPTAAGLSAGATVPAAAAFVSVVPAAAAGADSPVPAAAVVAADPLPADELADWPVGAEPVAA